MTPQMFRDVDKETKGTEQTKTIVINIKWQQWWRVQNCFFFSWQQSQFSFFFSAQEQNCKIIFTKTVWFFFFRSEFANGDIFRSNYPTKVLYFIFGDKVVVPRRLFTSCHIETKTRLFSSFESKQNLTEKEGGKEKKGYMGEVRQR